MLILHMANIQDSLVLWAEKSKDSKTKKGKHPWSATPTELREISPILAKSEDGVAVAWLPTADDAPVPSSGMLGEMGAAPKRIAPWKVASLNLSVAESIDILSMAYGKRTLKDGVIVGEDMAWWTQVLRQAISMVARQQYLPDAVPHFDEMYKGVWNPAFVGEDAEWLDMAAAKMPASGRALTRKESKDTAFLPAVTVLWNVMSMITDHVVRTVHSGSRGYRRRRTRFDSDHDAWLHSLRSHANTIFGTSEGVRTLVGQIREWQAPIGVMAGSSFRICFRIEEPAQDQGQWTVRYLVQPNDDPSLLVPADMAWNSEEFDMRGHILFALGQAAGICPDISNGITKDGPVGYKTSTSGAYQFLTRDAEALSKAGYGVILPAWWTGRGNARRLTAKAKIQRATNQSSGILTLNSVMKFNWEVALGDQTMSVEELEAMAALKSPLVRMRGQWAVVSHKEIRSAIRLLKKRGNKRSLRDMIKMDMGMDDTPEDLEWGGVSSTDAIADIIERLNGQATVQEPNMPKHFAGELRPYQRRGYAWLSFLRDLGLGGCLADDMGLGKTVQTLTMIQRDIEGRERRPALLVCPTSVINNWKREAARFTPNMSVMIHHGSSRTKSGTFARDAANHALVVTSYGILRRDVDIMRGVEWSGIVADEAQNIKNPYTKQAQAIRSITADYKFALTGTPVENGVADLWSIMEFLNPGFLGGAEQFQRDFVRPIKYGQGGEAADRLRRATSPFILRRLKTDKSVISDLPDKIEIKEYCSLTKEQTTLYASVLQDVEHAILESEGIARKGVILGALAKLKQVCNHPAHFLKDNSAIPKRSGKLDRLIQMLEEVVETGDKALIFTQFVEMGDIIKQHIQETFGREVLFLHGGTPRRQRDIMVERFGNDDTIQIFILSLKAGGTGLNLTAANHVFHFDRWWNPAVEDQATDRAFRIGQTKNVQVRKMMCIGTLEEKIDQMIEKKKQIAGSVVGTGEGWIANMSNEELREVLALSREAME